MKHYVHLISSDLLISIFLFLYRLEYKRAKLVCKVWYQIEKLPSAARLRSLQVSAARFLVHLPEMSCCYGLASFNNQIFGKWYEKITVYNLNGKKIKDFNCPSSLASLAFDRTGVLYFAIFCANTIEAYTRNGQCIKKWECPQPCDITITNDQIIVLCSRGVIYQFALDGKLIKEWNSHVHTPKAITIDGNEMFIVDDRRIVVFSTDGTLLRQWGTTGPNDGEFNDPNGIAVSENVIFVVDSGNERVQVFHRNGKYAFQWTFPDFSNTRPLKLLTFKDKIYVTSLNGIYVFEVI